MDQLSIANRKGNAAIVILSCKGKDSSIRYIWQRKTPGYPYPTMVGSICLFGGNKEDSDATARDTLVRELREELPAWWADEIEATLTPFSRYLYIFTL